METFIIIFLNILILYCYLYYKIFELCTAGLVKENTASWVMKIMSRFQTVFCYENIKKLKKTIKPSMTAALL